MLEKYTIRTAFGVITNIRSDEDGSLYITNENNREVKMSDKNKRWFRQIPEVKEKCIGYKGRKVDIITSQTTKNWKPAEYFCDVVLIIE
ncbi:hypothetical protein AAOGI_13550 [Agarivorans albus]